MKTETKSDWKGFAGALLMGVAKAGVEFAANVSSAEAFMTIRRSVQITNISERRLEIEHKGKKETLRVTIKNPLHLITIISALKSGQKIDLVLSGYSTSRTGKTEVLTADIIEINQAA